MAVRKHRNYLFNGTKKNLQHLSYSCALDYVAVIFWFKVVEKFTLALLRIFESAYISMTKNVSIVNWCIIFYAGEKN